MKTMIMTSLLLLSVTAKAIPPRGTLPFRDLVKQSQAYQNAMDSLGVTEGIAIETVGDEADVIPELKAGTCKMPILSRSGAVVKVTANVNGSAVILYFGSISSLAEDTVLCE